MVGHRESILCRSKPLIISFSVTPNYYTTGTPNSNVGYPFTLSPTPSTGLPPSVTPPPFNMPPSVTPPPFNMPPSITPPPFNMPPTMTPTSTRAPSLTPTSTRAPSLTPTSTKAPSVVPPPFKAPSVTPPPFNMPPFAPSVSLPPFSLPPFSLPPSTSSVPSVSNSIASGYLNTVYYSDDKCTVPVNQNLVALDYCMPVSLPPSIAPLLSGLGIKWVALSASGDKSQLLLSMCNGNTCGNGKPLYTQPVQMNDGPLIQTCRKLPSMNVYASQSVATGSTPPQLAFSTGIVMTIYSSSDCSNTAQIAFLNATVAGTCFSPFGTGQEQLMCSPAAATMQTYSNYNASTTCSISNILSSQSVSLSSKCSPSVGFFSDSGLDVFNSKSGNGLFFSTTTCFAQTAVVQSMTFSITFSCPSWMPNADDIGDKTKVLLRAAKLAVEKLLPNIDPKYFRASLQILSSSTSSSSSIAPSAAPDLVVSRRRLGASDSFVVDVSVVAPSTVLTPTDVTQAKQTVTTSAFTNSFQASLSSLGATGNFSSVTVASVQSSSSGSYTLPSPNNAPPSSSGRSVNAGMVAGVVIGVLVFLSIGVAIYSYLMYRSRKKVDMATTEASVAIPMGSTSSFSVPKQIETVQGKRSTMPSETPNPMMYSNSRMSNSHAVESL